MAAVLSGLVLLILVVVLLVLLILIVLLIAVLLVLRILVLILVFVLHNDPPSEINCSAKAYDLIIYINGDLYSIRSDVESISEFNAVIQYTYIIDRKESKQAAQHHRNNCGVVKEGVAAVFKGLCHDVINISRDRKCR